MTRAGSLGLCSAKARSLVTPGDPELHDAHLSRRFKKKISHGSCQTVIETLSPCWTLAWSMANLVMCCGIIVEVRKALGATFVGTAINNTVENTGYTNDIHTIRTTKTHLCHLVYFFCTYMDIGALPRRCRPFSLTERPVFFFPGASFFGKCRTGHDLFICQ